MALNLVVTTGLALGIAALFGHRSLIDLLQGGLPWLIQALWGAAAGLAFSVPVITLITRVRWFDAYRRQMDALLSRVNLDGFNPLWFSLCAGIGEELLCRGALQPLLGSGATSAIFTLMHYQTGNFRSMNRRKALYAVTIFVASLGLGMLAVRIGLIAAIVTHTVIDIVALTSLRRAGGPRT
jgi:membrane protease YdiL (CAAX protease family)